MERAAEEDRKRGLEFDRLRAQHAWTGELYDEERYDEDYVKILRGIVKDLIAEGALPGRPAHYTYRAKGDRGIAAVVTAWALPMDLESRIHAAVGERFKAYQMSDALLIQPDPQHEHGEPKIDVSPPYAAMMRRGWTYAPGDDLEEKLKFIPEDKAAAIRAYLDAG